MLNGTKRAFAVYNPNDEARRVAVPFADLCLGGTVSLRDVFSRRDLGEFTGQYEVTVPAHGTRIYVAECTLRLERRRYEAETAFIGDYQELTNNQAVGTGIYQADSNCSSGYKVGWLGCKEENDLIWRDVYSENGGDYTMTIAFVSGDSRTIRVDVNGRRVKTLSAVSGDWSTVATKSFGVTLQKGQNTIRLYNPSAWMPDIDYIELTPETPSGIGQLSTPSAANQPLHDYDLSGRAATDQTVIHVQKGIKRL